MIYHYRGRGLDQVSNSLDLGTSAQYHFQLFWSRVLLSVTRSEVEVVEAYPEKAIIYKGTVSIIHLMAIVPFSSCRVYAH